MIKFLRNFKKGASTISGSDTDGFINHGIPEYLNLPDISNRINDFSDDGRIYDVVFMGNSRMSLLKEGTRLYIFEKKYVDQ
jgi:hypothetical protein